MTHYPAHVRDSFTRWVERGNVTSETATVEEGHEDREVSADSFLASLRNCSDVMPRDLCDNLGDAAQLPVPWGTTYGHAAMMLLAFRAAFRVGVEATPLRIALATMLAENPEGVEAGDEPVDDATAFDLLTERIAAHGLATLTNADRDLLERFAFDDQPGRVAQEDQLAAWQVSAVAVATDEENAYTARLAAQALLAAVEARA